MNTPAESRGAIQPEPPPATVTTVNKQGRMRFGASMKPAAKDRWISYRLSADELAPRILARLAQLDQ